MLPAFATESLTIYYAKKVTARGTIEYQPQVDPEHSISVTGCSVQPTTTSENLSEPREQTLSLMTAWIPDTEWARVVAGGDLHSLVYEWRGIQMVQYGQAMPWVSPTGTLGHVVVYLREYRG